MKTKLPRDEDGKLSAYAWPGGQEIMYLDAENNTLCAECANESDQDRIDWPDQAPVAFFILEEGEEWCEQCNKHFGEEGEGEEEEPFDDNQDTDWYGSDDYSAAPYSL